MEGGGEATPRPTERHSSRGERERVRVGERVAACNRAPRAESPVMKEGKGEYVGVRVRGDGGDRDEREEEEEGGGRGGRGARLARSRSARSIASEAWPGRRRLPSYRCPSGRCRTPFSPLTWSHTQICHCPDSRSHICNCKCTVYFDISKCEKSDLAPFKSRLLIISDSFTNFTFGI